MPNQKNSSSLTKGNDQLSPKEKFDRAFKQNTFIAKSTGSQRGSSKIAQIGIVHMLNQMKNPLTNIRLCLEMMKNNEDDDICREIIRNSSETLEKTIRDLVNSFSDLGISVHLEEDNSSV